MKKIRWGIISTGRIANDFASDFKYVKKGELRAVASRSIDKAKKFAAQHRVPVYYGSYEELYKDPEIDVIYVATPHNFHFENAAAALQAGKAVLCEKPITTNSKEFKKLKQVAESSESYLMEGLWTYFLPATIRAEQWVNDGRIGAIKHIKTDFCFKAPFDPEGRLYNPDLAGGALLDIGIYTLALPWLLTKKKPEIKTIHTGKASTGVDDEVQADLVQGDCRTSIHFSLRYTSPNEAIIIGENGFIRITDFYRTRECLLYDSNGTVVEHFQDNRQGIGFHYEIDAVNEDLLAGKKASERMPLYFSEALQEQMDQIRSLF